MRARLSFRDFYANLLPIACYSLRKKDITNVLYSRISTKHLNSCCPVQPIPTDSLSSRLGSPSSDSFYIFLQCAPFRCLPNSVLGMFLFIRFNFIPLQIAVIHWRSRFAFLFRNLSCNSFKLLEMLEFSNFWSKFQHFPGDF